MSTKTKPRNHQPRNDRNAPPPLAAPDQTPPPDPGAEPETESQQPETDSAAERDPASPPPASPAEAAPILVELPPLLPVRPNQHTPRRVQSRLGPKHGRTLKQLYESLDARNARLEDGTPVRDAGTAVRWLLERIAAEADAGK